MMLRNGINYLKILHCCMVEFVKLYYSSIWLIVFLELEIMNKSRKRRDFLMGVPSRLRKLCLQLPQTSSARNNTNHTDSGNVMLT